MRSIGQKNQTYTSAHCLRPEIWDLCAGFHPQNEIINLMVHWLETEIGAVNPCVCACVGNPYIRCNSCAQLHYFARAAKCNVLGPVVVRVLCRTVSPTPNYTRTTSRISQRFESSSHGYKAWILRGLGELWQIHTHTFTQICIWHSRSCMPMHARERLRITRFRRFIPRRHDVVPGWKLCDTFV